MSMEDVEEVVPHGDIRRLPGTRHWVVGVMIRRGTIVGVVDPARLAAAGPGAGDQVIVVRGTPGLGLLAERTDVVTRDFLVGPGEAQGSTPGPATGTVLRHGGETFHVLELEPLRRELGVTHPSTPLGASPESGETDGEQDPSGR